MIVKTTLSRRALMMTGPALFTAASVTATGAAARVPQADLRAAYGVCAPFLSNPTTYTYTSTWMRKLSRMGVRQLRGRFAEQVPECRDVLALCRQYKIQWLMVVCPEDWSVSPAGITARMKWLHDNDWHDVVLGFENINEPDHERGGGNPPADWPERVLDRQVAIWNARNQWFPGVPVLSSSLHDIVQDNTNGAGYLAIKPTAPYVNAVAMHSYPKGKEVTTGLAERLDRVDRGFPNKPVWLTETGWTTYNKVGSTGPVPTTEANAAIYGAQVPATIAAHPRVNKAFRFECLDDAGADTNPEFRYGLFRPDGTRKPEAHAVSQVLGGR